MDNLEYVIDWLYNELHKKGPKRSAIDKIQEIVEGVFKEQKSSPWFESEVSVITRTGVIVGFTELEADVHRHGIYLKAYKNQNANYRKEISEEELNKDETYVYVYVSYNNIIAIVPSAEEQIIRCLTPSDA